MFEPLPPDFADALRATSDRRRHFGQPAYYVTETSSTNDLAAQLAESGAPEGTIVVASAQTAGRGRLGRSWYSPPDAGLYVSIVCRDHRLSPVLTLAGGVAVARGVKSATGLPVEIKWPNDVVVPAGGVFSRRRKLAGVLAEASSADTMQYVVLGIGVNLRGYTYPSEIAGRATSLELELGRSVDAGLLLAEILAAFAEHVLLVCSGDTARLLERCRALAPSATGSPVEYESPSGRRLGTTAGIADDGALLVRTGDHIERVIAGELIWK
jgi:BirA family biotin operon repressor/biotin-[acetyl-CoA-carboxylase] ligase